VNLLFILIGPIIWGIFGLVRGRMPISAKRELRAPHLARFAWMLILIPVAHAIVSIFAYLILTAVSGWFAKSMSGFLMCSVFTLLLFIAGLLSRAKRYSTPVQNFKTVNPIHFDDQDARSSEPDFSDLDQ
jgi:hypothetical protein